MIARKLIALTLVLSLGFPPGFAQADEEGGYRPLSGGSARVQRLNQYLKAYEAYEKSKQPMSDEQQAGVLALPADKQWEAMLDSAAGAMADKQLKVDRVLEDIAKEVAQSGNGGSFVARKLDRAKAILTRDASTADPDTYSGSVFSLLELYEAQPEMRPAVEALLKSISEKVADEILASQVGPDPFFEHMLKGTMVAWGLMMVWSWRHGIVNGGKWVGGNGLRAGRWVFSRKSAQWAVNGGKWVGNGFGKGWSAMARRLSRSKKVVDQVESAETALMTAADVQRTRWIKGALQKITESIEWDYKYTKARIKYAKRDMAVRGVKLLWNQMYTHGADLLKAGLTGGVAGALYGLNANSVPVKADPLEALAVLQVLIAGKLSMQINDLRRRMQLGLTEETAPQFYAEYWALTQDVNHLIESAPHLGTQVPWPLIAQEMKAVRSAPFYRRMLRPDREKRLAVFMAASERFSKLAEQMSEEIKREAESLGMDRDDQRFVSLGPAVPMLAAIGAEIEALMTPENASGILMDDKDHKPAPLL